jgi:hypothetical protein
MKRCAGILILLIAIGSYAQQNKIAITFCPLAALDENSFPTIQAGVEYKPGSHFSFYNEFGVEYMPGGVDRADSVILRAHGIKAKTELRYYFRPENYFAFNAFITSDAHNTGLSYFDLLTPASVRTTSFGVHKNVLGWNLLYGWKERLGGRFWVDCYFGLGMRFRYIRTVDDQLNSHDQIIRSIDVNIASMKAITDSQNGWSTAPNLTVGVRLVYRFGPIVKKERPPRRLKYLKPPVLGTLSQVLEWDGKLEDSGCCG